MLFLSFLFLFSSFIGDFLLILHLRGLCQNHPCRYHRSHTHPHHQSGYLFRIFFCNYLWSRLRLFLSIDKWHVRNYLNFCFLTFFSVTFSILFCPWLIVTFFNKRVLFLIKVSLEQVWLFLLSVAYV